VTYLAKFLPSRQSHSINSECTYLPWPLRVRARVCRCADGCISRGLPRRLSSLCEYLAKYFTHREIFTHYTPPFPQPLLHLSLAGLSAHVRFAGHYRSRGRVSNHCVIDLGKPASRIESAPRDFIFAEIAGCWNRERASSDSSEFTEPLCNRATITYSCGCITW